MKTKLIFLIIILFCNVGFLEAQLPQFNSKELKEGWTLLFDGKTLDGWKKSNGELVSDKGWKIENGCITAVKGGKGGDIITAGEYSDFELTLDFNIESGCNSGIKYFYTKYATGENLGMEYQILDDKLAEDNKKENHLCGSFYDVLPVSTDKKMVNAPGEWNTVRIVSKGKKVEHWLNGVKILEFTRGDKTYSDAVARSKFNKSVPVFGMVEKGHILLQEHGGEASFRNIKIKLL